MNILAVTSRTISLELENDFPFYAEEEFEIIVNSKFLRNEKCNVFTIYDLEPDTSYKIEVMKEKITVKTNKESLCLNVKDFHTLADGLHDDTAKFQAAIACCPKNGCVYVPEGTYLISTIFLKSDMTFYLAAGAKLITKYDRLDFPVLPGTIGKMHFGTWEGSFVDNFASSICAIGVERLNIVGLGEIDERASMGDWYLDHHTKRIAWRGYGMYLKDCCDVNVVGIYIHDTPAWNIHPFLSNQLQFINLRIENPVTMPTTDGLDPDCCSNVLIAGCTFSVGDDCIAIKSGTLELAKEIKKPSKNIMIRNNYMSSGHGGVVFGSECSGGIQNVVVEKCIFDHIDRGLRIKTRRGRGAVGGIDKIVFQNIHMKGVLVPFVINMYYNMGSEGGHEEYVWSKKRQPVDERTPVIGHFKFYNMKCEDVGYAAGVFLGLPESMIAGIEFENVSFDYNPDIEEGYPVMVEHNFKLKNAGLYCLNVGKIMTKHVTFHGLMGDEIDIKDMEEVE